MLVGLGHLEGECWGRTLEKRLDWKGLGQVVVVEDGIFSDDGRERVLLIFSGGIGGA